MLVDIPKSQPTGGRFSTNQYSLVLTAGFINITAEVELDVGPAMDTTLPLIGYCGVDQPRYCRDQASIPTGVAPGISPLAAPHEPPAMMLSIPSA